MLMRSVSGIRGIVGEALDPITMSKYVNAFIQTVKAKKIVVGRDSRPTGEHYQRVVCSVCEAMGVDVIVLGLSSTPTVEMAVLKENADGGIIISSSHNPVEWNALKLLKADGTFLNEQEIKSMFKTVDANKLSWAPYTDLGQTFYCDDADDYHIEKTLSLPYIDLELIRSKNFKVAFDAVNGAGSKIIPKLLDQLGCDVYSIYCEPDGTFPRGAEPVPESLTDLSTLVKKNNCVVGFATDPDADRCALVDETGTPMGEEYSLAICADLIQQKNPGPMTVNLSTSLLNSEICKKYNQELFRSKVGEINVSTMMMENKSTIGGEGNGGIILPDLHYGRDGILTVALVLQWLAESDSTLSSFKSSHTEYIMSKGKVSIIGKSIPDIYQSLKDKYSSKEINTLDGVWINFDNAWAHVRASNTEPIIRVMTEAETKERSQKIFEEISQSIS